MPSFPSSGCKIHVVLPPAKTLTPESKSDTLQFTGSKDQLPEAERTLAWDFLQLGLTHLNPREIHPFLLSAAYFMHITPSALRLKRSCFQTHHSSFSVTSGKRAKFYSGLILTTAQDKTAVFTLSAWDTFSSFMKSYVLMWQSSCCLTALLHSKLLCKSSMHYIIAPNSS